MAFALSELFWIGIVPSATAAMLLALCRWLGVRSAAAWAASVGGAIVVGQIGLALRHGGNVALRMLLSPSSARDWLPWLMLAVLCITILAAYVPRAWQRWIVALASVFALTVPVRLLAGSVYATTRWSLGEKLFVVILWGAILFALWTTLALGRANRQSWLRGALLVVVASGIAMTITLSGSFSYGELAGVAAAAITGALLAQVALNWRAADTATFANYHGLSGAAGPVALILGGLLLLGHFYAELSSPNVALLAISLAAAAGRLPTNWPAAPGGRAVFRIALCLVPLLIAIALAASATANDPYAA
jgi:hypothetical protein